MEDKNACTEFQISLSSQPSRNHHLVRFGLVAKKSITESEMATKVFFPFGAHICVSLTLFIHIIHNNRLYNRLKAEAVMRI